MSMRWMMVLIVAGFVGVTGIAFGQEEDRPSRRERLLEHFDTNGDGRLDKDERERARKLIVEQRGRQGDHKALPQTLFPDKANLYKLAAGPHEIEELESFELRDAKRDKVILLRITWPKADGPWPLVVFCHGALGSKDGGDPMAHHWAGHGYVVIRPTFGDSISLMTDAQKKRVRSIIGLLSSPQVNKQWDQRPMDVQHVLDSLDLLQREVKGLAGKIDATRIAVAGHSYGAHTTMLLSGLALEHPRLGKAPSFFDKRIKAFVAISPQGPGKSINETSYQAMRGPMLMVTGDNDGSPMRGQEDKAGTWRKQAFDHAPAGDRFLLWIKDAYHGFGGINGSATWPGAGPAAPDQVLLINSTTTAFFDAYLRNDREAHAYLHSDQLDKQANGLATLTVKRKK